VTERPPVSQDLQDISSSIAIVVTIKYKHLVNIIATVSSMVQNGTLVNQMCVCVCATLCVYFLGRTNVAGDLTADLQPSWELNVCLCCEI